MTEKRWKRFFGNCAQRHYGGDFPEEFCMWTTADHHFKRWAGKESWVDFFELRGNIDTKWLFADGSYVQVLQHVSGARTGEERAIGSRVEVLIKIHMAADVYGNPVDFEIIGGEVHEAKAARGS